MEEHFVSMTTRRIKPGTLADSEREWRPDPEGLRRAFGYWSDEGVEVIGVSFWDTKESCDAWRASEAEARRRVATVPYVLESGRRSTMVVSSPCRSGSRVDRSNSTPSTRRGPVGILCKVLSVKAPY